MSLQTAKPMDFGDFSLDDFNNPIDDFVDIVNMPYDDNIVDKNIKDLLSGKGYQPEYKYKVKDFLVAEQENLAQSLNPDNLRITWLFRKICVMLPVLQIPKR